MLLIVLKLHGYHWLTDQDFYDVEIQMQCSSNNVTFFESSDPDLRSTIYDLDIIINIESKFIKYLGKISYGIYMYHMIVVNFVLFLFLKLTLDLIPLFLNFL